MYYNMLLNVYTVHKLMSVYLNYNHYIHNCILYRMTILLVI